MSSLTIDEKLLLVEKMRNQSQQYINRNQHYNTSDVGNKSILSDSKDTGAEWITSTEGFRFFKYRIVVCLVIFFSYFALYKTNFQVKGHHITAVNSILEKDMLPEKMRNALENLSTQIINDNIEQ